MGIREILRITAQTLQVEWTSLWLHDSVQSTWQVLESYNLPSDTFSDQEWKLSHSPYYLAQLSQYPLLIDAHENAQIRQELSSYLDFLSPVSRLDCPIINTKQVIGSLVCEETHHRREFSNHDQQFVQLVSNNLSTLLLSYQHKQNENLQMEPLFGTIIKEAVDAIIVANTQGRIAFWNHGAQNLFGYESHEMIHQALTKVIPQQEFIFADQSVELQARHKEGQLFPVQMTQTKWKHGLEEFDTLIIRDLTLRETYERRLIEAMSKAKACNQTKSFFLTMMSHELRTPLNSIIGFTECLLSEMDGPLNPTQQMSLKKIKNASFSLLNLVNDILGLAKIEASKIELRFTQIDLIELCQLCIEDMQQLASQKQLELKLTHNIDSLDMYVDPSWFKQVIINLLSNAIKFTEKGTIELKVQLAGDEVKMVVKDTGIGLSPVELEKIFQPFAQADHPRTHQYQGTGLGLVICQKIVELHGGSIKAQSQKGVGSTFTVKLPLQY